MKKYIQIKSWEREKIFELWQSESSIMEIAEALQRSRSTIYRELKRNQNSFRNYLPDTAQNKSDKRRLRGCCLDKNHDLQAHVMLKLRCHGWTPEQIAGDLKFNQDELKTVSHETIYSWIYKGSQRCEKLWKYLPRHHARRGKRKSRGSGASRIPHRISIHDRPKIIDTNQEFGHFEGDLMCFKKNSQHILVLRERKTMFTLSAVLPNKTAEASKEMIIKLLGELPMSARKSITFDNGTEFTKHGEVATSLGLQTFFCDAYASWQKGGVENTNGYIRRDFSRSTGLPSPTPPNFR